MLSSKKHQWKWLAGCLIMLLLLTACGSDSPPESTTMPSAPSAESGAAPADTNAAAAPTETNKPETLTPVSVGLLYLNADAGMFIALEKGYFKEEGLDVQLQRFNSGSDIISILATSKLDVGSGSVTPGLMNSFRQGMDIKIVASKSNIIAPEFSSGSILVRKDLWDGGNIKDAGDLKGMRIALNAVATTSSSYLIRALEAKGLTKDDVTIVEMPFNQMMSAFEKKAVDAAMVYSPLNDAIQARGLGVAVPESSTAVTSDGDSTNLMFYSPEFAESEAAKQFMVAHTKGLRDYYDAVIAGKGNKEEIFQILGKHLETDPQSFNKIQLSGVEPNGEINMQSLERYQEEWIKWGYQKEPADIKKNVDTQYIDYAVQQLGEHK